MSVNNPNRFVRAAAPGDSEEQGAEIILPQGSPTGVPVDSAVDLLRWYETNLCEADIRDPRGFRVCFNSAGFIHFIKLTDRHGKEPKNQALAVDQIRRGRLSLKTGKHQNFDPKRIRDLACAVSLVRDPHWIVPNWQTFGRAYPGEVYIRDFGTNGRRVYRVLVCGFAGKRRIAITMFSKNRIADIDLTTSIWP